MSKEKTVYGVGQKLVFTEDCELNGAFGSKKPVKKGTKIFVGADGFAHHLNDDLQPIGDDAEIKGFSPAGIAEWLYERLNHDYYLDEMLEAYDTTREEFMETISESLEELGMYPEKEMGLEDKEAENER